MLLKNEWVGEIERPRERVLSTRAQKLSKLFKSNKCCPRLHIQRQPHLHSLKKPLSALNNHIGHSLSPFVYFLNKHHKFQVPILHYLYDKCHHALEMWKKHSGKSFAWECMQHFLQTLPSEILAVFLSHHPHIYCYLRSQRCHINTNNNNHNHNLILWS